MSIIPHPQTILLWCQALHLENFSLAVGNQAQTCSFRTQVPPGTALGQPEDRAEQGVNIKLPIPIFVLTHRTAVLSWEVSVKSLNT